MVRPFQEDDRQKRVVTAEGRNIGRVREVQDERATIDRSEDDDGLTEEIKDMLGWGDDEESHEIRREHVDRHEDDRLYLRTRR